MSDELFNRVVAATKLSPLLAPHVVRRVCVSQGLVASDLEPADLPRLVPVLAQAAARYLDPTRVPEMESALATLARGEASD